MSYAVQNAIVIIVIVLASIYLVQKITRLGVRKKKVRANQEVVLGTRLQAALHRAENQAAHRRSAD